MLPRLRETAKLKLFLREETSDAAVESLNHGPGRLLLTLALPFATGEVDYEHISGRPPVCGLSKRRSRDHSAVVHSEKLMN
jgi:LysR family hydrogen peroxide-inducible transcriptional activator